MKKTLSSFLSYNQVDIRSSEYDIFLTRLSAKVGKFAGNLCEIEFLRFFRGNSHKFVVGANFSEKENVREYWDNFQFVKIFCGRCLSV
jgi:hypothetical protein